MATEKQYAYYIEGNQICIVEKDTTSTDTGERTREKYDTFQSEDDVANGLRITFHSKYETISTSNLDTEMSGGMGLDTGMQNALLCYVKARLFEDQGDMQKAQYFRQMYAKSIKQYPTRKSGVRQLAVSRL